ncbi:3'(2'),5'-bisphosphate nucleotidase CysQ [Yoonia sp. BS5-3]|uniref:3'(2'),5'-bisphosphate nucleotidase CysQ n=1 Tax=Yoonia phaeophyticola TaxID=3137369 RepID=A0ABZ2V5S4_9RHOB
MPGTDLDLLSTAARAAGEIAMGYFCKNPAVNDKPDGAGPVTEADLAVNAMLEQFLAEARPDYGWLSEETEDGTDRLGTKRQFVIDPIDGTRGFIEGSKDWGHALAVVEDGRVIDAAVFMPVRDLLFTASAGKGAARNGAPIQPTQTPLEDATILGAKINLTPPFWKDGQVPPVKRTFRSSLAYRLCLVADGSFDGMLTFRPSWEWDIAAGALIATEAGAIVTDQANQVLRFNNPHPQVPGVLAAGPKLHKALAARLEPGLSKP